MENCGNTLNVDVDLDEVERLEERSHHIHTFEEDFLLLLRAGPHEAKEIVHRHLHLVDAHPPFRARAPNRLLSC